MIRPILCYLLLVCVCMGTHTLLHTCRVQNTTLWICSLLLSSYEFCGWNSDCQALARVPLPVRQLTIQSNLLVNDILAWQWLPYELLWEIILWKLHLTINRNEECKLGLSKWTGKVQLWFRKSCTGTLQ